VQTGGLRGGKTFLWRTILHSLNDRKAVFLAVWMDKLAQRGAKLKL
jgi:hypothetical protein